MGYEPPTRTVLIADDVRESRQVLRELLLGLGFEVIEAANGEEAVALVRENPDFMGGMAPIYGLAATVPDRSLVHGMLQQVMDVYYRV